MIHLRDMIKKIRQSPKYALTYRQLMLLAILIVTAYIGNKGFILSVILAGIVAIVPVVIFASVQFYYSGARQANKIATNFYKGEALKIFAAAVLFMIVFLFAHVEPAVFFGTYILISIAPWFVGLKHDYY